jgi:hypothetical protein
MLGSRWDETRDALLGIADYALKLNVRSVSLRFLNCDIYDQGIQVCIYDSSRLRSHFWQGEETIKSRFDGIMPNGKEYSIIVSVPRFIIFARMDADGSNIERRA